ncbi:MAG: response regulator transcription factor [Ekhidna sp.]|nr:response regulator transcription factor [Ekhidna sp.]
MRLALVDDDTSIRENLKILLSIYAPDCRVIGEASGVKTGLDMLKKEKPDVLLLDVEMQDGTGFDLLSIYGELDFKVIFVTGHNAYAIKAFKYSALDYILKPVDPEEIEKALKKARDLINLEEQRISVSTLVKNRDRPEDQKKIVLKDTEALYLISVSEIIRCEAQGNYTRFYISDGRMLTITKTLKEYHQLFENQSFFRSHQSHLINLVHFDRFEKKEGGIVFLKDGSMAPVSVRKKDALFKALESLN